MGKIIAGITTSVDGYVSGPDDGRTRDWGEAANACTTGCWTVRGAMTRSTRARSGTPSATYVHPVRLEHDVLERHEVEPTDAPWPERLLQLGSSRLRAGGPKCAQVNIHRDSTTSCPPDPRLRVPAGEIPVMAARDAAQSLDAREAGVALESPRAGPDPVPWLTRAARARPSGCV
jgi:hypothetical protein